MHKTFSIILLLLLAACGGGGEVANGELPESLEEKQALLREKQAQLRGLTQEIEALEKAIIEQDPSQAPDRALVTVREVEKQDFNHFVDIQGTVEADDLVEATSEISGRILQVTVDEGDAVRRGQLIAVVDVEQISLQIAEVETSLDLANTVFERQKRLWEQNIGSEIQYLEAKNNKERLEKSLEQLRAQLKKSRVYAPISGVVDEKVLQAGELAGPGSPIVRILNTNKLKVVADVPENYLTSVRVGEQVRVRVPALGLEQTNAVTLIGRTIDPDNRTFKIEVVLKGNNSSLKPNLLAEVLVQDFSREDVIVVPLDHVQQEVNGNKYVFVQAEGEEGPVAKKVYVETGSSYNQEIIITEGLSGGEKLIMEGARGLNDGQLIEIASPKTVDNDE